MINIKTKITLTGLSRLVKYLSRKLSYVYVKAIFSIFKLLFKVQNNKIIFSSYNHNKISCNPKYVAKYILDNYASHQYDIVWILRNIRFSDRYNLGNARIVKFKSIKYIYEISTAKIIISNQRTEFIVGKRKHQKYIQLWHSAIRLKKIEGDAREYLSPSYLRLAKRDSDKTDLMVSGSQHSTEIYKRAFWYSGKILNIGTPRNDLLFFENKELFGKIKDRLGIDKNTNIILYAPTFRRNYKYNYNVLNLELIRKIISNKTQQKYVVLLRYHPNLINTEIYDQVHGPNIINASSYDDIQELIAVSDYMITDYSSAMFDFCLTSKPCFLFVSDFDQYYVAERKFYFGLTELPFPIARTSKELVRSILLFNENKYRRDIAAFLAKVGSYERGNACPQLMKYIDSVYTA